MKHLWAPWRMDYVAGEKPEGCVLCQAAQARDDAEVHVIYQGKYNYVILNRFPYNSGHLMVVPYEHTGAFTDLSPAQLAEMMAIAQGVVEAFQECLRPDGVNLGINLGQAAGAGINDHLHLHIVPRWAGDTNFMTVLADTRVVPQSLGESCRTLKPALQQAMERRRGETGSAKP